MNDAVLFDRISLSLGGREILKNVSFSVQRGDIFGYLGPNGAGKTTTIRVILGLFQADSGIAYVLNENIEKHNSRTKIGFMLESDGLYENLSAKENLDFYCQLYDIPVVERDTRIAKMLDIVGLGNRINDKISTFSKGMRQKLALARAMIHDPELLILDEPTTAIDPIGQIEVREIILRQAHEGKTIFLSSHNLDEVQRICNRVAIIDNGQIKMLGRLEELKQSLGRQEILIETNNELEGNPDVLNTVVNELGKLTNVANCYQTKGQIHILIYGRCDISELMKILLKNQIEVEQIRKMGVTLSELYTKAVREVS